MNKLYFDGGCAPNPGKMHQCFILNDKVTFNYLGQGTNNEAEWTSLCMGLEHAKSLGIKNLEIFGDSQLAVNQAKGMWKVKTDNLKPFKARYDLLAKSFDKITIKYIPRGQNIAGHVIEEKLKNRTTNHHTAITEKVEPQARSEPPRGMSGKTLSDDQTACFETLREFVESDEQTHVVQGLAGTGKTTVLTEFANEFDMNLVAYTGKAASVLREKSALEAQTIHSLIYLPILDAKTGALIGFENIPQNLSGHIIGVDEYSMVNERIGKDLLSTGAKILAFGDPGQLPPVEGKPFFTKANFTLTDIHRQAKDSPIIRQAHAVKNGGSYQSDTDKFQVVSALTDDHLLQSDIVLCWTNKTRKAMNHRIRALKGFSGLPKAGESVVCLQNAAKYGLFNGAIYTLNEDFDAENLGKISLNADGVDIVVPNVAFARESEIYFDDVRFRVNKKYIVSAFDHAGCLTTHKSQGSEWKNVALIDEYRRPEDRIKWVYTSITRAAESIVVSR